MSEQAGKRWGASVVLSLGLVLGVQADVLGQGRSLSVIEQFATLQEAERLNQQVTQLYKQGKYQEAISLAEQALRIRKSALDENHPDVAWSLNDLARLYYAQGQYDKAEPLFQQALSIYKTALGNTHPAVATILNNLAGLYRKQGQYDKAEPLLQQALSIRKTTLDNTHPDVANSLNSLAELYYAQGQYGKAEPLYQQALSIYKTALGKTHPDIATTLNNLALLYYKQGQYDKAEPLYQQALSIRKTTLDNTHPDVANSLNSLAGLYYAQGQYGKAEPLYQQALSIRKTALGNTHPDVADSLNSLAGLYYAQGQYGKAEPLYQQALSINKTVLGNTHPAVAANLNNLAGLYSTQGQYSKAESLLQQVLSIYKTALGDTHPHVATTLNNLASLYYKQMQYGKAEPLFQQALSIRKTALGNTHPDVATTLNNLAALYRDQGQYGKAEPLLQQALSIYKTALGDTHPDVAITLSRLVGLYYAQGELPQAVDWLERNLRVEEINLITTLAFGSEQQKQDYLKTVSGTTDISISLAFQSKSPSLKANRLALTTALRRKGRVLDAVSASTQILLGQKASDPAVQKLYNEWRSVLQQQSNLVYRGLGNQTPEQYKATLEQLETERDRLEAMLSRLSSEFRQGVQPVELASVQQQIPQDAALVEIVQYYPFNPKAKLQDRLGKPRHAAAILRTTGEPIWVDLGDAATVDKAVQDFRTAIQEKTRKFADQKLHKLLLTPLLPHITNVRHLLISPDGQLSLIPFEALQTPDEQYLIQKHDISYLTSGRDLLRFPNFVASQNPPVLFSNINYTQAAITKPIAKIPTNRSSDVQSLVALSALPPFNPLSFAKEEAQAIQPLFNFQTFKEQQATETVLKQLSSPSLLHLTTHAFYISAPSTASEAASKSINLSQSSELAKFTNPLLQSGIALAGINDRKNQKPDQDDGVLTSLEVAALNLQGTQLVVVSGCQTGEGEVRIGEGVYGLRRALVISGAQSQVLSLWAVDDQASQILMARYYTHLKAGKSRHEALKLAQLSMIEEKDSSYNEPYYWAAFLLSGDWRPLKVKS